MPPRVLALVVLLSACSASPGPTDGGASEDAGPESCTADRACPGGAPVWGGGCEGTLSCAFPACGTGMDVYECVAGTWSLTVPEPCAGVSPPLAESCPSPETATVPGARLWLSEDVAGAPELEDGDLVEIVFGAQGLAMIPFRVHVDGDAPPRCARVTATLAEDAMTAAPSTHDVRLRCGDSLRIQDILPELPCDEREYAIGLDVTVEGVGSVSLDLRAMGGGCPLHG